MNILNKFKNALKKKYLIIKESQQKLLKTTLIFKIIEFFYNVFNAKFLRYFFYLNLSNAFRKTLSYLTTIPRFTQQFYFGTTLS